MALWYAHDTLSAQICEYLHRVVVQRAGQSSSNNSSGSLRVVVIRYWTLPLLQRLALAFRSDVRIVVRMTDAANLSAANIESPSVDESLITVLVVVDTCDQDVYDELYSFSSESAYVVEMRRWQRQIDTLEHRFGCAITLPPMAHRHDNVAVVATDTDDELDDALRVALDPFNIVVQSRQVYAGVSMNT